VLGDKSSMKIQVISPNYPSNKYPEEGVFVRNITAKWAELGNNVDVIHPAKISFLNLKGVTTRFGPNEKVYRPVRFSYSSKKVFCFDTHLWSLKSFVDACQKQSHQLEVPNFIYAKFLLTGAYAGVMIKKRLDVPVIADIGESVLLENLSGKKLELARYVASRLDGAVCVSERLKSELIQLGLPRDRILLLPNQADPVKFRKMDRMQCRTNLGLPQDAFIVSFVGGFIHRKGPDRVLQAIEFLRSNGHQNIFGVFLGKGGITIEGGGVLIASPVNHDELPAWLNASNVFVLPTLAEGSCNAIEEAKSVGLPIVTANIPDVAEQVSSTESILVNPLNPQEIANAILYYKNRGSLVSVPTNPSNTIHRSELVLEWVRDLKARER
jgi:teichuronic acid biosynthesis glycosyltransferase TuaC